MFFRSIQMCPGIKLNQYGSNKTTGYQANNFIA